jgi:hypothetical protein
MAAMATKLGDQTADAGARISDFSMMLANTSIPRLDNFGISSGKVRQRINELLETGQALSREEAFKMAVMEEGSKALATLGDTSDQTAVKIDQVAASFKTLKQNAAAAVADIANNSNLFGALSNTLADAAGKSDMFFTAYAAGAKAADGNIFKLGLAIDEFNKSMVIQESALVATNDEIDRYKLALEGANPEVERYSQNMEQLGTDTANTTNEISYLDTATLDHVISQGELEHTVLTTIATLNAEKEALGLTSDATYTQVLAAQELALAEQEAKDAAEEHTTAQNELAIQLKDTTSAGLARAAIQQLTMAHEDGTISTEDYNTAVREIALSFGLADEKSLLLASGVQDLVQDLSNGEVSADNVAVALSNLKTESEQARWAVDDLGNAVRDMPDSKDINIAIKVNQRTMGYGGSVAEGMQDIGEGVAEGLALGIDNGIPAVQSSVDDMTASMMGSAAEALGVQSPSTVFAEFGRDVVRGFVEGVNEEADTLDDAMEVIFDFSDKFERLGGTAARMYQDQFIDPMEDRISELADYADELERTIAEKRKIYEDEDTTESERAAVLEELLRLNNELALVKHRESQLSEELLEREQTLLDLEKQRQDLAFVQQQLDLVRFAQAQEMSMDVFEGLEFGANANLEDWVQATTDVVAQSVAMLTEQLQEIDLDIPGEVGGGTFNGGGPMDDIFGTLGQTIDSTAQSTASYNATLDSTSMAISGAAVELGALDGAMLALASDVNSGASAWRNYASALNSIDVPEILQPGSPPPLAYALGDINSELSQMRALIPGISSGFDSLSSAPQSISNTTHNNGGNTYNITLPNVIDTQSLLRELAIYQR